MLTNILIDWLIDWYIFIFIHLHLCICRQVPSVLVPSVLWRCWLGGRKGIRSVKYGWWGAGVVVCLARGADLHMAQPMPLPLTVSCFSKIQIGFTFLVPAHPGSPGQRAVKRLCVCVCVCVVGRCAGCSTTSRWRRRISGSARVPTARTHCTSPRCSTRTPAASPCSPRTTPARWPRRDTHRRSLCRRVQGGPKLPGHRLTTD